MEAPLDDASPIGHGHRGDLVADVAARDRSGLKYFNKGHLGVLRLLPRSIKPSNDIFSPTDSTNPPILAQCPKLDR